MGLSGLPRNTKHEMCKLRLGSRRMFGVAVEIVSVCFWKIAWLRHRRTERCPVFESTMLLTPEFLHDWVVWVRSCRFIYEISQQPHFSSSSWSSSVDHPPSSCPGVGEGNSMEVWRWVGGWRKARGGGHLFYFIYLRFLASTVADWIATGGRAFHSTMVRGKKDFCLYCVLQAGSR